MQYILNTDPIVYVAIALLLGAVAGWIFRIAYEKDQKAKGIA